jgi:putative oxidoreductase
MSTLTSKLKILDSRTDKAYALIRMFLGIALLIRGLLILSNPDSLIELGVERELFIWVSFVGIVHVVGGLLLFLGIYTRLAALIQIPILISAIFYVYKHTQLMMGGESLELAVLVLFLLCLFLVVGSGPLSVNQYFSNKKF